MKKLILIAIACFALVSCDNVNFNTSHVSFDGSDVCIIDTVIITVDSLHDLGFRSPNLNISLHGDTIFLKGCETVIKK